MKKLTRVALGCHIDGAFGIKHTTARLLEMVDWAGAEITEDVRDILESPEDAEFIYEVIDEVTDILNDHVANGLSLQWIDGDLILIDVEE